MVNREWQKAHITTC